MPNIANPQKWIAAYLESKDSNLADVAQGLRRLVKTTVAGTTESVNPWKIPTFESNGPMCFFTIGKNHVSFGFLRATSLSDPAKLLEGTGKNLRHVKLRTPEDLSPALINLIQAAARLNEKEPMEGMSQKRLKRLRRHYKAERLARAEVPTPPVLAWVSAPLHPA